MKRSIFVAVIIASLALLAQAQAKSNDAISKQIKDLKAGETFRLSYDQNSNVSKLMAVTENFPDRDASRIGIQAMNFAVGFLYSGQSIAKAPDNLILTFWVLTKKPRFTANHNFTVGSIDLGTARYASKPRENIEYLNFEISRENLAKIAVESDVHFQLGDAEFSFTRSQLKTLADILILSDPSR